MEKKDEKIGEALMKVALGYQLAEVTEEYAEIDGEMKLTKRKKTKKDVPPDLKAVQLLLSADGEGDLSKLSDAELEEERQRLLATLSSSSEKQPIKKTVKKAAKNGSGKAGEEAGGGFACEKAAKTVETDGSEDKIVRNKEMKNEGNAIYGQRRARRRK